MIMMGGTAAGFLMVNLGDSSGFRMFIFSSVLISSAVIPVALTATSVPPLQEEERMKLGELFNIIPAAVVGLFLASFVQASTSSMSTVYGTEAGMTTEKIALFTAAGFVGAVLLQFPLGALSDRFPRRSVIIGATVIAGLLALMGALTSATGSWIVLIHLCFGAFVFPLYGLFLAWLAAVEVCLACRGGGLPGLLRRRFAWFATTEVCLACRNESLLGLPGWRFAWSIMVNCGQSRSMRVTWGQMGSIVVNDGQLGSIMVNFCQSGSIVVRCEG